MKIKILIVASLSLFFFSCKKEMNTNAVNLDPIKISMDSVSTDTHNSQNSLDWQGTYKGITPCADCEGIETEVVLNKDLTFVIKTKYLGKGDQKTDIEKGTFTWQKSGTVIFLKGFTGKPNQFKVGENTLIQPDNTGNIISGLLSEKYILKKE